MSHISTSWAVPPICMPTPHARHGPIRDVFIRAHPQHHHSASARCLPYRRTDCPLLVLM